VHGQFGLAAPRVASRLKSQKVIPDRGTRQPARADPIAARPQPRTELLSPDHVSFDAVSELRMPESHRGECAHALKYNHEAIIPFPAQT
jgi:hypothetical protein